ncbi:MAG TPA: transposase [Candidatus Sulfotelmatobacter sp.]|nr:transposase [Candidatus Sulfotelmatobacter sp.]HWI57468.1 transposase [Bacillota bacterium]
MITKLQYIQYLLCTPRNYTCTNLAKHLEGVSHDTVCDYLQTERLTARQLWEFSCRFIDDSPQGVLIGDDSVQDKRHSRRIELVRSQYSGAEKGMVDGIGVVNLVHSAGVNSRQFYPIDYRIYAPQADGKTKNEHFREMLLAALADKRLQARTLLVDIWYASAKNLKLAQRLGLVFFAPIKTNRMVSLSKEGGYVHLQDIDWTPKRLQFGVEVKLKQLPFKVRLFKLVATDGDIDWVITNSPERPLAAPAVQDAKDGRWPVEELHRDLKQLTGSAKCQCRKARSQRTHLACCYQAWLALKVKAQRLDTTLYALKTDQLSEWLRTELRHPSIPALQSG